MVCFRLPSTLPVSKAPSVTSKRTVVLCVLGLLLAQAAPGRWSLLTTLTARLAGVFLGVALAAAFLAASQETTGSGALLSWQPLLFVLACCVLHPHAAPLYPCFPATLHAPFRRQLYLVLPSWLVSSWWGSSWLQVPAGKRPPGGAAGSNACLARNSCCRWPAVHSQDRLPDVLRLSRARMLAVLECTKADASACDIRGGLFRPHAEPKGAHTASMARLQLQDPCCRGR